MIELTISLVIIILLAALLIFVENDNTKLSAQPISKNSSDTIFDKIIDDSISSTGPDKFLESKGSFAPNLPPGADTGTFDLMARFGPVIVYSNNIKNNSESIDFDQVPATIPHDFMKFMPPYHAVFYVFNIAEHNITINNVRISQVVSKEAESPFDFCGMNYNTTSIHLRPGYTQTFSICFYPKEIGNSSAKLEFNQGSRSIFDIPLRGTGVSPVGLSENTERMNQVNNQSNKKSINLTGETAISDLVKKVPDSFSNLTSDSQSSLLEPLTDCSISIEGGGQRPDPAVNGHGSNTVPLEPPDDGINMTDDSAYHHRINVGQLVKLEAKLNGVPLEGTENIRWTIAGSIINDYDESVPGEFVTYSMEGQDYLKPVISFYWRDEGDKVVTVSVEGLGNNQSIKCDASRTFAVERNRDDVNRQAEDFYVFNHNAILLEKHFNWHDSNPQESPCDPLNNGEEFFLFHKGVISNFDTWRETFGYPKIIAWDPADNPPNSKNLNNEYRNPIYSPQPIPSYYTPEGGNTNSICAPFYQQEITKLSDYESVDHLASEIEITWHGEVHMAVGGGEGLAHVTLGGDSGDMSLLEFAPKDPVFWMWHKNIDSVYDKYREFKGLQ